MMLLLLPRKCPLFSDECLWTFSVLTTRKNPRAGPCSVDFCCEALKGGCSLISEEKGPQNPLKIDLEICSEKLLHH